jgi:hypothetical protein
MSKKIFALLCLSLAAAGCGKSDPSQSGAQAINAGAGTFVSAPAPGQPITYTAAPQIQGQYPYFFVNYRVDEAGCSTGWRRFSGNDAGYVRALMCQSFLNDSMNQNCGRTQRQQWYQAACGQGY